MSPSSIIISRLKIYTKNIPLTIVIYQSICSLLSLCLCQSRTVFDNIKYCSIYYLLIDIACDVLKYFMLMRLIQSTI